MNGRLGAFVGLTLACGLGLWRLGSPAGHAPAAVQCQHAAELMVAGEAELLCGPQVDAAGLFDGERRLENGQIERMPPESIEWLGLPVDVNRASQVEIATLPGIGPTLAARIIQGRPYADIEALDEVRGIGPRKLERLEARARVSSPRSR